MKAKHLVFFDGKCGLCDHIVQFLFSADKRGQFAFAPLQGKTAATLLKNIPDLPDSLVLIENFQSIDQKQIYLLGRGALRICWLLGGFWILLGWISFLPPILYDWSYRLVARNRHRFYRQVICKLPDENHKNRFFP